MRETIQQPDPPSQICPSCGAPLRGLSAFCPSCGAVLRALTGRLQTTQVLAGRYRIERLMARGGMGAVYRAEDTRLGGAPVAVKEMASSFVRGDTDAFEQAVADFRREAAILARLRHPHLPRVSDQFDEDGKHYLVMEFIAGHTLSEELRRAGGRLPLEQALAYADQLCDVLSYLHSQSPPIIYRDLKPSNVMVMEAEPRTGEQRTKNKEQNIGGPQTTDHGPQTMDSQIVLIDFGIARFYRPGQAGDTAIYGTTGYAPPEQYGRGQTDARTDIYALGVLLHQLLTGHDPTSTPFALPPSHTLNPAIPPQVADTIAQASATDRQARFADIAAFRAALHAPVSTGQQVVRRSGGPATAPAARPAAPGGGSGRVWALVGIMVVLLAAGALTLGLLGPLRRANGPAPTAPPAIVVAPTAEASPEPPDITPAIDSGSDSLPTAAPNRNVLSLRPIAVRASSTADPGIDSQGSPVSYDPQNAVDGQPGTTWRVAGDGVGQWIELDFGAEVSVQSIGLIPGYDKIDQFDNTDRFFQSRVVRLVRLEFSGGTQVRASFAKSRDMQFVSLPSPIRTHTLRIVIEATYPPPPQEQGGRDFTPISEVLVQGMP